MKKKLLAIVLCVCTVFSMTACSKGKDEGKGSAKTEGKIELGEYKGYTVGKSVPEVTEDKIQQYIDALLSGYTTTQEVTEGVTAAGDKVKVTYHQYVNDAEVGDFQKAEDGSSLGITETVTLSADSFLVPGFTDGLTGKNIGETVEMDLQFPEDYSTAELAGQPVHYSVVINSVSKESTPEFNDAFVTEHYAFAGCNTVAEFKELVKQELSYIQINSTIWDDVIAAQKVKSYPSDELKKYVDMSVKQIEQTITSAGYTMDTYYQIVGKTEDEVMKEIEEKCKEVVKEKMFVREVAKKEGITYDEEAAKRYAALSGYTSVEQFKEYLEAYDEDLEYAVLAYQVENFISDSVKLVADEELTTDGETAENTDEAAGTEVTSDVQETAAQ